MRAAGNFRSLKLTPMMFKRQNKTARKSSASHQSDSEPRPATVSTPIGDFVCYPELTPFTEYYLFPVSSQSPTDFAAGCQKGAGRRTCGLATYPLLRQVDAGGGQIWLQGATLVGLGHGARDRGRDVGQWHARFSRSFRGGLKAARCMCAGRQTSERTVLPSRGRL